MVIPVVIPQHLVLPLLVVATEALGEMLAGRVAQAAAAADGTYLAQTTTVVLEPQIRETTVGTPW
jgi:hypothetical protein